jgi:hypothetical protein
VPDPPTAPGLVSPVEGAVLDVARPELVVSNATSPEGLALSYAFELYAVAADGTLSLVEQAAEVPEGDGGTTSWIPSQDLANDDYSWRARAVDAHQPGPWMPSAHFVVALDHPPAAPTGLAAVPGDTSVSLSWDTHPEPDVAGYRVYRGDASGGPYSHVADVTVPSYEDTGLANGVTVFYVVTAVDSQFESGFSGEAAATPQGTSILEAEVRLRPAEVRAECLRMQRHSWDKEEDDEIRDDDALDVLSRQLSPAQLPSDISFPSPGWRHEDDDDDKGCWNKCPSWLNATIELPSGRDPGSIDLASVRLAGSVGPENSGGEIVDTDQDGIPELKLRFSFERVAPLLEVGENELSVTGWAGAEEFQGIGRLTVLAPRTSLHVWPRWLSRWNRRHDLVAWVGFKKPLRGRDVEIESVRLNESVPVKRVVLRFWQFLVVTFDRAAVDAVLPKGKRVEVRVSGVVDGLPFTGVDRVRVVE